jgi:signal transduction histidine kinase
MLMRQVAHQIRQPLSVIEAIAYFLDLVLSEAAEEGRSHVGKLRQQAHEIDRILSDTIHYLQASPPRFQQVDLARLVSHYVEELPPNSGLLIEQRLGGNLPRVEVDVQQVQHMLGNLLLLLTRIAPAGQTIGLAVFTEAGNTVLKVETAKSNYGADEVGSMFAPFVPHAVSPGLMLASAGRIAAAHRASISVDPAGEGGLSMSVTFPSSHQSSVLSPQAS